MLEKLHEIFMHIVEENIYSDYDTKNIEIHVNKVSSKVRVSINMKNLPYEEVAIEVLEDVFDELIFKRNEFMKNFSGNIMEIHFSEQYKKLYILINLDVISKDE